jgi:hypothetical protein
LEGAPVSMTTETESDQEASYGLGNPWTVGARLVDFFHSHSDKSLNPNSVLFSAVQYIFWWSGQSNFIAL